MSKCVYNCVIKKKMEEKSYCNIFVPSCLCPRMTQCQALAIKIPALAYCCRNRGWFHPTLVTDSPESTNSTLDCQWLSGHCPRRKSGYVSLANRERNRVFTGSRMSVAGKHTAAGWWEWGVLFAIKGSCRAPLTHALVVFSDSGPQGARSRQLPAHVWGEWRHWYHPRVPQATCH